MSALGLLVACSSGPSLDPDAAADVSLAGSWKLNRQASADPDALIAAIVEKEMQHMRRRSRYDENDPEVFLPPVDTGRGESRENGGEPPGGMFRPREGMAAHLRAQYTNALGAVLSGEGLVIEQSRDRFVLVRSDSRRSFTPGGRSVVGVADGVADQSSGWKGREYVIDVRPQVGPHVTERYGITPSGQLLEKVSLSGDGLPKLEFTRLYDKGTPPVRVVPTNG